MNKNISFTYSFILAAITLCNAVLYATDITPEMIKGKETRLGKYIFAKDAYSKWLANPEKISILDVRTVGEYVYVGHAPMARNLPLRLMSSTWDVEKNSYPMPLNPGFVENVRQFYAKEDTILVMCRSGGRSRAACDLLADNGFTNVYNIIDGFEGDSVKDPSSYYNGKRMLNGWKNSGAPWTYELNPELVYKGK